MWTLKVTRTQTVTCGYGARAQHPKLIKKKHKIDTFDQAC
jgi:hypothetical protein